MFKLSLQRIVAIFLVIFVSGCASKLTQPDKFSGYLNDYSGLQEARSYTDKPVLRWISPDFNPDNYDSIVYNPVTYYPKPKPSTQIGQNLLDQLLTYTNTKLESAVAKRKPVVSTPGPRSLIFQAAITGVSSEQEGLQFYEVVPVALIVASTQMATGHRTMDTRLYLEGELIDASTNKPVVKIVRMGEGKTVPNEKTPLVIENLKNVVDDIATDIAMYGQKKNS